MTKIRLSNSHRNLLRQLLKEFQSYGCSVTVKEFYPTTTDSEGTVEIAQFEIRNPALIFGTNYRDYFCAIKLRHNVSNESLSISCSLSVQLYGSSVTQTNSFCDTLSFTAISHDGTRISYFHSPRIGFWNIVRDCIIRKLKIEGGV